MSGGRWMSKAKRSWIEQKRGKQIESDLTERQPNKVKSCSGRHPAVGP